MRKDTNLSLGALAAEVENLKALLAKVASRQSLPDAAATIKRIRQASHGFSVGNPVRHNGTSWVKSQANTAANAVVGGLVIAVPSVDMAVIATGGYVTGLTGLTAGAVHYLHASTAGALTTTAPSPAIPVLMADSATSGILLAVGPGGSGSVRVSSSNPTATDDSSLGNSIGTLWVNTATDKAFIAADVTPSAAIWIAVASFPATPTGTGWVLTHNGSIESWSRAVILGNTSAAGSLTISNATSASAISLSPSLVNAAGKVMAVREIDVCDAGVAKKMLVLASAPY